ncbi:MAG: hypothetical protein ACLFQP_03565 [Halothece sp.]
MTQQHYRMTLNDAIAHYQQGDITAKGLVHFYLKIRLKPEAGWILRKSAKEICEELGIGKTAFYNAMSRLKAEGSINWSVPSSTQFSISLPFRQCGKDSTNAESDSVNAENQFANVESNSAIAENDSPKASNCKDHSDSPNSYQIFINSLSESERVKFKNFCRNETANLPRSIVNLGDYLAANDKSGKPRYLSFWEKFQSEQPKSLSLTEQLYAQWDEEFRSKFNCDYHAFAGIEPYGSPEWELRANFCQEWDRRNHAVSIL